MITWGTCCGHTRSACSQRRPTYRNGTRTMQANLRKYSTSLLTFGVYMVLIAFALACSLGLL